jgi:hypothetical protein
MMRMQQGIGLIGSLLFLVTAISAQEAEPPAKLPEPKIGALFHYDYQHPDLGFRNADNSDAMTVHPLKAELHDFKKPAWHRSQIDGMIAAGLDFFAPLYAGPGQVGRGDVGLKALMEAWTFVEEAGGEPPLIAPYIDTRPLLAIEAGATIRDLRRPKEMARFAEVFAKFFETIQPEARFQLGEFLVIFVGPSFGVPHERDFFEKIADSLYVKLRRKVFIVAEQSWQARRPSRFRADSALMGPRGDTVVRFIGPGYDDSRLRGRGTPRRDREETRFYRWAFDRVLLEIPTIAVVDSWNDYRQGTAIAPSREFGRRYLDLTRQYALRMKSRVVPDARQPVRLAYPDPLPRPDTGWFKPAKDQKSISFRAAEGSSLLGQGLRLARVDDGSFRLRTAPAPAAVVSPGPGERYLYFGIADEYASRVRAAFRMRLRFLGGGQGRVGLQYDSWNRSATLEGRYAPAPTHLRSGVLRERTLEWTMPDARFANRQNGGTDFRLVLRGDDFELLELRVERLDKSEATKPTLVVR